MHKGHKPLPYFFHGLALAAIWGFYSLKADTSVSQNDTALLLTILGGYLVSISNPGIKSKLAYALPGFLYITAFYGTKIPLSEKLANPINWYFLALMIVLLFKFKPIGVLTLFLSFLIIKGEWPKQFEYKKEGEVKLERFEIKKGNKRLNTFHFASSQSDSTVLQVNGRPFLIQTWAEWCAPCIRAIQELPEAFIENNIDLNHLYLYSDNQYHYLKDKMDVFGFEGIADKENIIVSEYQDFERTFSIKAKPSFIFFNQFGHLDTILVGYDKNVVLKHAKERTF